MKSLYFNEDHELFRQSVVEYVNKKKLQHTCSSLIVYQKNIMK